MDKNKKNVPKIRFPGFTDPWEQRKLETVATFSKGRGYSKSDLQEEGTPIILYGRLYTKYETCISKIDTFVEAKDDSVYSKGGEVIVPASGETAEDIARASSVEKAGVVLGGDLNVLMPNEDINSSFLALSISNGIPQKDLAKRAQGKSVVHVHNEDIKELNIYFPELVEQVKISTYFKQLDNLITIHQRKLEHLKDKKKGLLQKMFPKEGEKFPELRFPGFTEPWKQSKLGDVMSCVTDYVAAGSFADIKKNVTYSDKSSFAQLVRTVDLKKKFINDDMVYVDENAFDYLWRVNLNEDCIVLPNIGANIGEVYYVKPSELPHENNVLGPNAILLKSKEENYFVFTSLTTDIFQSQLFENVGSSGQPKFNKTELKTIELMIPNSDEQKKIGDFFRSLDHLITLHQRKLEHLQQQKKGLLQQMFI